MKKPITIEVYDPQWPRLYEEEKARLLELFGNVAAAIEHIGSTSIPGLGAKPIIDIMVGVPDLSVVENYREPLEALSYEHMFSQPDWCHFSKKTEPRVNLHLRIMGSDEWAKHLLFRDYLRSHPDVLAQYQALKQEVAAKHSYNPAYVQAKAPFIEEIIEKARKQISQSLPLSETDPWQDRFIQERSRLLAALGEMTAGGIVDNLQHIGATSVPGLPGRPCLDIGLSVWPFPLEPQPQAALERLGYEVVAGYEGPPEQRFRHSSQEVQLYIVDAGSELWTDYLLLRDYLCHDTEARQRYAARKQSWTTGTPPETEADLQARTVLFGETLESARRWWIDHHGFGPVERVARELEDYPHPWYISSGWALDLFLGRVTRVHHDVDVVVSRIDQLLLQTHLMDRGWKLLTPLKGRLDPWPVSMRLELPRHQVHAHREGAFIDFLLTDLDHGVWRYRRDPSIIQTVERIGLRTGAGIPFLAPELVLLFKSKNTSNQSRDRDQVDFEQVSAHLSPDRRAWLRWALLATDPAHPWIAYLGEGNSE